MGGRSIRAALLALALALPGCAWFGPSPAQQQLRDAQRARAEAGHDDELAPKPRSVEERLAEADRYLSEGRRGQARWNYLEAHRVDPGAVTPRLRIGYVEVARDRERAEALFASIVKDAPDSAEAHAGLGLARFAQNRLGEARADLERAVALDPES